MELELGLESKHLRPLPRIQAVARRPSRRQFCPRLEQDDHLITFKGIALLREIYFGSPSTMQLMLDSAGTWLAILHFGIFTAKIEEIVIIDPFKVWLLWPNYWFVSAAEHFNNRMDFSSIYKIINSVKSEHTTQTFLNSYSLWSYQGHNLSENHGLHPPIVIMVFHESLLHWALWLEKTCS